MRRCVSETNEWVRRDGTMTASRTPSPSFAAARWRRRAGTAAAAACRWACSKTGWQPPSRSAPRRLGSRLKSRRRLIARPASLPPSAAPPTLGIVVTAGRVDTPDQTTAAATPQHLSLHRMQPTFGGALASLHDVAAARSINDASADVRCVLHVAVAAGLPTRLLR